MLQYVTIHRIALGTCIFFWHTCLNNAWSMSQWSNLSISWIAPSLFAISPMQVPDLGQVPDFQPQIARRCGIFKDDYLMVIAQIIRRSSIFKDHYLWWLSKNVLSIMFTSGSCGLITIMGICKYVSSICLALLPFFSPPFQVGFVSTATESTRLLNLMYLGYIASFDHLHLLVSGHCVLLPYTRCYNYSIKHWIAQDFSAKVRNCIIVSRKHRKINVRSLYYIVAFSYVSWSL